MSNYITKNQSKLKHITISQIINYNVKRKKPQQLISKFICLES